jgi:hypothetical protein
MTTFNTRVSFDHVRNSASGWTSENPVLGYGVIGLETDTGKFKIGNGTTQWNSLLYSGGEPARVSVSTVTASQNNWSIGNGDIYYLYSGSTNTLNVTGIATSAVSVARLLINVSTHTASSFTLKHDNTNSTAVARLLVPWQGDYVMSPNGGAALIVRSEDDERWRVV